MGYETKLKALKFITNDELAVLSLPKAYLPKFSVHEKVFPVFYCNHKERNCKFLNLAYEASIISLVFVSIFLFFYHKNIFVVEG